ncbi:MAG: protein translocase subunit SecF [Actinobacteria bacterium]|nr:protein translocase subunit SecF [Actinomycetota bacterium]MCL5447473.1 protein translocase subunit SecF [Actinomycetota bacterium]
MTTTSDTALGDTGVSGNGKLPETRHNPLVRLYRGETHFDFVGRRRRWYLISILVILAGLVSLGVRGLNFGIEFRGGTSWEVTAPGATVPQVRKAMTAAGLTQPIVEILGGRTVEVQADLLGMPAARAAKIKTAVQDAMGKIGHISPATVSINDVGPTWGGQVTQKALIALIAFFVGVVIYISFRFEWKMAIAALIAVFHDLLVVVGVYSLTGFQVTPDTAIAVLTILGYSLYDTVVVFDRVGENTKGLGASGRMTYESVVNLSMNQVLARSVNTSLVAILPVLSVLVIGAQVLGATTLQSFGLALVIGLTSGAYSSIFIASPVLATLKEKEPRYRTIRAKLEARLDRIELLTPKEAALLRTDGGTSSSVRAARRTSGRASARNRGRAPARAARPASRQARVEDTEDLIRPTGASKDSHLEAENAKLRAELDAMRAAMSGAGDAGNVAAGEGESGGAGDSGPVASRLAGGTRRGGRYRSASSTGDISNRSDGAAGLASGGNGKVVPADEDAGTPGSSLGAGDREGDVPGEDGTAVQSRPVAGAKQPATPASASGAPHSANRNRSRKKGTRRR